MDQLFALWPERGRGEDWKLYLKSVYRFVFDDMEQPVFDEAIKRGLRHWREFPLPADICAEAAPIEFALERERESAELKSDA